MYFRTSRGKLVVKIYSTDSNLIVEIHLVQQVNYSNIQDILVCIKEHHLSVMKKNKLPLPTY